MTRKFNVILIFSINAIGLMGCGVLTYMILANLNELQSIQQKNESIIHHPYLSQLVRTQQKDLLQRSQIITDRMVQDPKQSIQLIQEIESLAASSDVVLEVQLNEQQQEAIPPLSSVPIQFSGHGSWQGVELFLRTLREEKPGFFVNTISLSNETGDSVRFTLNYSLLWQGKF